MTDAGEATTGGSWHGSPAMMMNLQHCSVTSVYGTTHGSMMRLLLNHYIPFGRWQWCLGSLPNCLCSHQNLMLIEHHPEAACNEQYKQMMSVARQSEAMSCRLGLQQEKGLKSPSRAK